MMNKELWVKFLATNLYDTTDWYNIGLDWSQYMAGSIVHIPQKGTGANVQELTNATGLPVAATREQFDELTFTNRILTYGPSYVTLKDSNEASFIASREIMGEMIDSLRQAISIAVGFDWLTVASNSIVPKTGATRENIYGQAGVESLTYQDILDARKKLSTTTKNVDLNNIYLLVDPFQYTDILAMDEFTAANELGSRTVVSGFVGEIAGIKVIQRSSGLAVYNNAGTWEKPAAIDYADGYDATHHSAALMFDATKVGKSVGTVENGEINVDVKPYEAGYFTDVMQGHTRVGASPLYRPVSNVQKGVVTIA